MILLSYSQGFNQNIYCGFEYVMANNPDQEYLASAEDCDDMYVDWMLNAPHSGSYIVPVVFHVMHNNGPENISDEQIYEAVRLANLELAGTYGGFDTRIRLVLATLDPNGNCTSGINRIETNDPWGHEVDFLKD